MTELHELAEPFSSGFIDVGDGHRVAWLEAGNPVGKPALILHGGPGSGSSPNTRRMFDPTLYRAIQFDQRNCGQSTPSAAEPLVDLAANTTQHLLSDIESLRSHLGVERWLVWGGSWGTTLALAYAEAYPERVSELVMSSITTTSSAEVEWITRTMARLFPERWNDFVEYLPAGARQQNLALAYNQLLMDPDPQVHRPAARAWCLWEDTHVSLQHGFAPRLSGSDIDFQVCFARLVTHYWANSAFLEDGQLLAHAHRLADVPTFMVHGRMDVSSPVSIAYELARAIPGARLHIVEANGHGGPEMSLWVKGVLDELAGA
ncbi:MAG: prolyl aminopeptidase [Acidimicrobiales bacterium]